MAVLLRASVLSDDEKAVVSRLAAKIRKDKPGLDLLDKYFDAKQRLKKLNRDTTYYVRVRAVDEAGLEPTGRLLSVRFSYHYSFHYQYRPECMIY